MFSFFIVFFFNYLILPEVELARKSETDGHTYSDDTIYCVFASAKFKI